MSAALNNPLAFQTQAQQLQEAIRQQVYATLNQMEQQRLDAEQATQQAAQPAHTPEFLKAVEVETKLINSAIQGNPALAKEFGKYNLESAIHGDGGPSLQKLANRIDDAVAKAAGFYDDKDAPLSEQRAVSTAVAEGSRHYASLDMTSVEGATSFATDVAAGSQSPDASAGGGDGDPFDFEREGDQPTGGFEDIDDKAVANHYRENMEGLGHQFEVHQQSIAETAPAVGEEPHGFFD